jgi:hypothetical protein
MRGGKMSAMYPTSSEEKYAYIEYVMHIAVMTGKTAEAVSLEGIDTISDLILKLDEKYPGFKELFMPLDGVFNSRTAINLRRVGQPTLGLFDEKQGIEDGDVLIFW